MLHEIYAYTAGVFDNDLCCFSIKILYLRHCYLLFFKNVV